MLNGVGIMLHQLFKNMGYLNKKKIDTDLTNHNFETFNPSDAHIHQKIIEIYKDFFDTTGRFPGNQRLISVPRGRIPDFIQSEDVISPRYMYERYLSRDMSGIVGVQFLAALNRYLGGEIEISRNAMSEFFHNLLWQALAADNDGILLQFEAIRELTHSVYNLLQREMNNERADSIRSGINFTNILSKNFTDKTRTVQDTVEDNLVQDIINNDQTNYRPQYTFPRPKTEDEIEKARVDENINFIEGELAKNACDFEIAADIEAQEKADLLRNILDPGFGLTTNEDVSALDAIRNNNGDSAIPHLDPVALRGMEQLLDNLKETIDLSEDETEDVKLPPEAVYPPIADVKAPDLQDLLTDDNQNSGILDNIREIRDNVKTEVEVLHRQTIFQVILTIPNFPITIRLTLLEVLQHLPFQMRLRLILVCLQLLPIHTTNCLRHRTMTTYLANHCEIQSLLISYRLVMDKSVTMISALVLQTQDKFTL